MTDEVKLEPCPWCDSLNIKPEWRARFDEPNRPVFECDDCGAQGPLGTHYGGGSKEKSDATERNNESLWNTRAAIEGTRPTAATDDVVKELVEALSQIAEGEGGRTPDRLRIPGVECCDHGRHMADQHCYQCVQDFARDTLARTGVTLNG